MGETFDDLEEDFKADRFSEDRIGTEHLNFVEVRGRGLSGDHDDPHIAHDPAGGADEVMAHPIRELEVQYQAMGAEGAQQLLSIAQSMGNVVGEPATLQEQRHGPSDGGIILEDQYSQRPRAPVHHGPPRFLLDISDWEGGG